MSAYPIHAAARTPAPAVADPPPATPPDTPTDPLLSQATVLARLIGDVLLANVQNTASLNHSAARALLSHARIPKPALVEQSDEAWRFAWRSFEICATSADRILNLTRSHVERTTSALWQAVDSIVGALAHSQSSSAKLHASLRRMREAQAAYWQATQQVHRDLLALAQTPEPERGHGAH